MRGSAVYIRDRERRESTRRNPTPSEIYCAVCKKAIAPQPGTGKQFVCAGTKKKKSECQKKWRYAQEHGISIEEAKQRHRPRRVRRGLSPK